MMCTCQNSPPHPISQKMLRLSEKVHDLKTQVLWQQIFIGSLSLLLIAFGMENAVDAMASSSGGSNGI